MNHNDKDICDRLYVAIPYGLNDHYLLIDARQEILKLREQLKQTTQEDTDAG